ncbi:MAG TPA: phospholipase D family protein [Bacteroidia bacterium]|jgi:phosphatidylserine/phosphatidylglycerophosphate/cardiolipin synthase-like enzyme|nr:phospholipase D family protein [Bacteroidia bacterium]
MKKILPLLILSVFMHSCSTQTKKEEEKQEPDFCTSIHGDSIPRLSEELAPFDDLMKHQTGVFSMENGDEAMITRAWLSENAEKTIDVQYFIFSLDNVGLIAVDYLVRAADRGIKVRILVDDILVDADEEKLLTLDSHENITIKIYNPSINIGKTIFQKIKNLKNDFRGVNQRMHNKTFIVDGKVVITGGRNIADEYFDYDHEYNFRDRDVLLIGGISPTIQQSFNTFWDSPISNKLSSLLDTAAYKINAAPKFEQLHQYACNPENFWPQVREKIKTIPTAFQAIQKSGSLQWVDRVVFVSDDPGKNDGSHGLGGGGNTTTALLKLVQEAKISIVIQSPYLVTTDLGKKLFKDAVDRKVDVKVMTNSLSSTDNLQAFSGYQRDREALLKTGINIFEYKPDAPVRYKLMTGALQKKVNFSPIFGLHAKTMVIDGKITVIGTFNLDPRSANLNTECVAIIYSEKIAQEVLKEIEEELKPENCWETTVNFNPDKEAGVKKNLKTRAMKVVPKGIL